LLLTAVLLFISCNSQNKTEKETSKNDTIKPKKCQGH